MPNPPVPRLSDVPGMVGPSLTDSIAFRNLMQLGYGVNVLLVGGGSVQFLLGQQVARVWASVVIATAVLAVLGLFINVRTGSSFLEMWASIGVFAALVGQCTAAVLCALYGIGPNGLLPFWWPAALAWMTMWRVRNIVRTERAQEAARRR